jgi:hypothetical protein
MIGLSRRHPAPLELSRAVSDGLTPGLERHVADCPECASIWSSYSRVDALARELPAPPTSIDHGEELLAGILASTAAKPEPRSRRAWWIPAAIVFAAAAVLLIVVTRHPDPPVTAASGPTYRGAVRAERGARFVRVSSTPDEVVRLYEGKISVDVTQVRAGERFRVVVADAEIEGHGTSFEVVAKADTLATVQVVQGRVDVRPTLRSQTVVIAGQRWEAEVVPVRTTLFEQEPEPATTERHVIAAVAAQRITTKPAPVDLPMAKLFDEGWQQLHAGDHRAAIDTFDDALAKYPRDPLAEDVAFWRGVALARAKHSADAIRALTTFADGYPGSPRLGEASAMLGWLLIEAGDLDEAGRRFAAALHDPVTSVRTSAEKGLAAVTAMRAHPSP